MYDNLVVYLEKSYFVLKKAVYMTCVDREIDDSVDAFVIWDMIVNIGDVRVLSFDARDLVVSHFKMNGNFIDPRILLMIRDYEKKDVFEFLNGIYKKRIVTREERAVVQACNDGFLDCASTTGIYRDNNEDFCLSLCDGVNKLLLVCDGIGGFEQGEMASSVVAFEFMKWFDGMDEDVSDVIKRASKLIKSKCSMAGTTLVMAVVKSFETLIFSVGDSRAYFFKDGVLEQVNRDDNVAFLDYYENGVFCKDDLRFIRDKNILTQAISSFDLPSVQFYEFSNFDYDGILLVSDGVSDVLSDNMILKIINENDDKDILDMLLHEACLGEPDYPPDCFEEVLYPTLPGKDNVSGAIYIKK